VLQFVPVPVIMGLAYPNTFFISLNQIPSSLTAAKSCLFQKIEKGSKVKRLAAGCTWDTRKSQDPIALRHRFSAALPFSTYEFLFQGKKKLLGTTKQQGCSLASFIDVYSSLSSRQAGVSG